MEVGQTVKEWKMSVEPAIDSKVQEFIQMGYEKTTSADIWSCLEQRVWKGNPTKKLHEIVQDIFHLSSDVYIGYLTMNAYQDDDGLMASIAALTQPKETK